MKKAEKMEKIEQEGRNVLKVIEKLLEREEECEDEPSASKIKL